jgi:hypothetical protein
MYQKLMGQVLFLLFSGPEYPTHLIMHTEKDTIKYLKSKI